MRCSSCEKFVSLDMGDPEIDGLEIGEPQEVPVDSTNLENPQGTGKYTADVTCSVRVVRNCADCGTEMKEATLELSTQVDVPAEHVGEGHDLEVEEMSVEPIEEGGGRYKKSFFGATVSFQVTCSCEAGAKDQDRRWTESGEMGDKVAASAMDELS